MLAAPANPESNGLFRVDIAEARYQASFNTVDENLATICIRFRDQISERMTLHLKLGQIVEIQ